MMVRGRLIRNQDMANIGSQMEKRTRANTPTVLDMAQANTTTSQEMSMMALGRTIRDMVWVSTPSKAVSPK